MVRRRRVQPARTGVRRWSSLRLFLAFQAAALVPFLGVGLALDVRYGQQKTEETLHEARSQAQTLADLVIGPRLGGADLATADPAVEQAALSGVLADPAVRSHVYRVKVWDRTGRIVASDDASLVGRRFTSDEERDEALAGASSAEVTRTDSAENASERSLGTAVEVYTPLHAAGDPSVTTGVLEIYLPYAPLAEVLQRTSSELRDQLALGLLALAVALGAVTAPVIHRLHKHAEDAARALVTDELTGLRNRAGLEAWLVADAAAGRPSVLVLADVATLHLINEAFGHAGGNDLLRHVGAALHGATRSHRVAHTGGGQFALLLPSRDGGSTGDVLESLSDLRERLAVPVDIAGVPVTPLLALGAAPTLPSDTSASGLVQRAEAALRRAKQLPSGAAVDDGTRGASDPDRLRLLTELRHAVAADELRLHYQPQVDARSGRTTSVEALVRWAHPQRGLLGPGDFLPLAERSGLITALTSWVVAEAARQVAAWTAAGADVDVSVNISARDLADPGFAQRTTAAVLAAGALPERVQLELTETALVVDAAGAQEVLAALATAGFRLSLDDFGQGATSLSQLGTLPLDEIKLDRAFVAGMLTHPADAAIVASVVQLGHNLGLRVVAEGVETQAQAQALRDAGYDALQGWHFARAVPAAALTPRLVPQPPRPTPVGAS